jgi:YD repeat-containing protein
MIDRARLIGWIVGLFLVCATVQAATATYGYDALGRLTSITSDDGKVVVYKLDPAGNRTQVLSVTPPASITVPTSNTTGSYSISWGASTGTVIAYKLYEATNPGFSGQTQVYGGTALSASVTGRSSGTYYYRVTACVDTTCSGYRTGANPVTVVRP